MVTICHQDENVHTLSGDKWLLRCIIMYTMVFQNDDQSEIITSLETIGRDNGRIYNNFLSTAYIIVCNCQRLFFKECNSSSYLWRQSVTIGVQSCTPLITRMVFTLESIAYDGYHDYTHSLFLVTIGRPNGKQYFVHDGHQKNVHTFLETIGNHR